MFSDKHVNQDEHADTDINQYEQSNDCFDFCYIKLNTFVLSF